MPSLVASRASGSSRHPHFARQRTSSIQDPSTRKLNSCPISYQPPSLHNAHLAAEKQRIDHFSASSLLPASSNSRQASARALLAPASKLASLVQLRRSRHAVPLRARSQFASGDEGAAAQGSITGSSETRTPSSTQPSSSIFTLPTCLTLARLAAVPLLVAAFYSSQPWANPLTRSSIFVVASLTDWLDGYLARKMGSTSAFGAFLDPVADKLMVATALILLCSRPELTGAGPAWMLSVPATAIIGREITMSALREWAASQDGDLHKAVAVNNYGKWKTASQMVALTILLSLSDSSPPALSLLGFSLLFIASALALVSLGIYFKGIWFAFSRT